MGGIVSNLASNAQQMNKGLNIQTLKRRVEMINAIKAPHYDNFPCFIYHRVSMNVTLSKVSGNYISLKTPNSLNYVITARN